MPKFNSSIAKIIILGASIFLFLCWAYIHTLDNEVSMVKEEVRHYYWNRVLFEVLSSESPRADDLIYNGRRVRRAGSCLDLANIITNDYLSVHRKFYYSTFGDWPSNNPVAVFFGVALPEGTIIPLDGDVSGAAFDGSNECLKRAIKSGQK